MPLENLEEEGLPKNPDLRIAQLRFMLSLPEHRGDAGDMAPYYYVCQSVQTLDWQMHMDHLNKMKANEELKRLDEELEDAEKNLGESEIRDAMMARAEYLCQIGDKR
ncbi:26S proteasome non-ATPase regulatory subunit 6-like [Sciurus carolinensis]|uniref:26S proteasome non-ATPase regulatory subunit 6-like n=1 Tax=Sciurus carolinensis TaxID=30640 RepID=UPI001FB39988|nr:26S proteasome non-ATPase regulatory subunit 6-like [Sciurus carolinensis]